MAWPVLPVVLESGITYALSRNLLERSVYLAYLKLSRELYPLTLFLLGKRTLSEDQTSINIPLSLYGFIVNFRPSSMIVRQSC